MKNCQAFEDWYCLAWQFDMAADNVNVDLSDVSDPLDPYVII